MLCFSKYAPMLMLLLTVSTGCQSMHHTETASNDPQFECGNRRPIVDAVGWTFGIGERISLWHWRAGNHHISPETQADIAAYMERNNLDDVKVRINQYDPAGEWTRLTQNDAMHPGWRYTFGTLSWLGYTVFPGRIFGGDDYNPYTNSIYVYSDIPSIGISEAAYAKDVHQRKHPGLYAFSQGIPGLNLIHENKAVNETLDDTLAYGDTDDLKEVYEVLYPRIGGTTGGAIDSYVTLGNTNGIFGLGGLLAGHAIGRRNSSQVTDDYIAQLRQQRHIILPEPNFDPDQTPWTMAHLEEHPTQGITLSGLEIVQ